MKKKLLVLMLAAIVTAGSLTGCNLRDLGIADDELFTYQLRRESVSLVAFLDEAKEMEEIQFPSQFRGRDVVAVGGANWSAGQAILAYVLKTLYLPHTYRSIEYDALTGCPKLTQIFICSVEPARMSKRCFGDAYQCRYYVPEVAYETYLSAFGEGGKWKDSIIEKRITIANISYYYNYEGSANGGYYWIDNKEEGEHPVLPQEEPARAGYRFTGWYREAECRNKWVFTSDTMTGEKLALYAGWEKE